MSQFNVIQWVPKAYSLSAREALSTCIYTNCRQRIHFLKITVGTSDRSQFSLFYVLNPFLMLTRSENIRPWCSLTANISKKHFRYGREMYRLLWFKSLNCPNKISDWYLLLFGKYALFSIVEKFRQFSTVFSS